MNGRPRQERTRTWKSKPNASKRTPLNAAIKAIKRTAREVEEATIAVAGKKKERKAKLERLKNIKWLRLRLESISTAD